MNGPLNSFTSCKQRNCNGPELDLHLWGAAGSSWRVRTDADDCATGKRYFLVRVLALVAARSRKGVACTCRFQGSLWKAARLPFELDGRVSKGDRKARRWSLCLFRLELFTNDAERDERGKGRQGLQVVSWSRGVKQRQSALCGLCPRLRLAKI